MSSGTLVITSDRGSLPEVAGYIGIICNPYDIDFIAGSIMNLTDENNIRDDYVKRVVKSCSD